MRKIFEENSSELLQGAIVWMPMLAADNLIAARLQVSIIADPRVSHYWDPGRILGQLLAKTLKLMAPIAWDVYLVYPPDHPWDMELPPAPELWMHQLDEEPAYLLDPLRFMQNVQAMIEANF